MTVSYTATGRKFNLSQTRSCVKKSNLKYLEMSNDEAVVLGTDKLFLQRLGTDKSILQSVGTCSLEG